MKQIRIVAARPMTTLAEIEVEVRDHEGAKLVTWTTTVSATEIVVQLGARPAIGGACFPRIEKRTRRANGKRPGPEPDRRLRRRNLRAIERYRAGEALSEIARDSGCSPSTLFEAMQRTARREGITFAARHPQRPRPPTGASGHEPTR